MASRSPIDYSDADGKPVDVRALAQGSDLIAQITVKNVSKRAARQPRAVAAGARGLGDPQRSPRRRRHRRASAAAENQPHGQFWWVPAAWRSQALRGAEYIDIRDDRVQRYFSLGAGESIFFETRLNAAYLGRFYLPGTGVEAMYDAKQHARLKGQWVEVISPQR